MITRRSIKMTVAVGATALATVAIAGPAAADGTQSDPFVTQTSNGQVHTYTLNLVPVAGVVVGLVFAIMAIVRWRRRRRGDVSDRPPVPGSRPWVGPQGPVPPGTPWWAANGHDATRAPGWGTPISGYPARTGTGVPAPQTGAARPGPAGPVQGGPAPQTGGGQPPAWGPPPATNAWPGGR